MVKEYFFEPWVGKNYWKGFIKVKKLLILGESHYGLPDIIHPQRSTTKVIRDHCTKESQHSYFTKLYKLFDNDNPSDQTFFWERIAFYNYIQAIIEGPRIAPTNEDWVKAELHFNNILIELQPDLLVVTGKRLWVHTPEDNYFKEFDCCIKNKIITGGHYSINGHKTYATFINHPSSFGFQIELYKEFINAFIENCLAGTLRNLDTYN